MGARAQVCIKDTGIYLYDHWGDDEEQATVQNVRDAIMRQERWSDPHYLAAIIFREMIKGDLNGATSFGIDAELHGDTRLLVTVDCSQQTIKIERYTMMENTFLESNSLPKKTEEYSFKEFTSQ